MTQDVDPAGAVLGLLFGGAFLVMLAAPLSDYSTINLELWGLFAIVAGIGVLTIGFFAGHSTASGWVGLLANHGKGHAAGLYLLGYYLGSSVVGSIGGLFWSGYGWAGVAAMVATILVIGLAVTIRLMLWQRRSTARLAD